MQQVHVEKPLLFAFDTNSHFARIYTKLAPNNKEPVGPSACHRGEPVFCLKPLLKLIEREIREVNELGFTNSHIVFVFDHSGTNFRHEIYPNYKANRPPKPHSWARQLELAYEMLQAAGYTCLRVANVETDDVLATLGKVLSSHQIETILFTGDKDVMSCCNDFVSVYDGKQGRLIREPQAVERFGVPIGRLLDLLALVGDAADNVPGAPGIGMVTAQKILNHCTLEQALAAPELLCEIKLRGQDGIIKTLQKNVELIKLSRSLVDLKTDVGLGVNFKDMVRKQPNYQQFLDGYIRPEML